MKFVTLLSLISFAAAIPFGGLGQIYSFERIIGGSHVNKGDIPYQVSLQKSYLPSHFCGGVIYNRRWIITAAHCLSSESYDTVRARIGTVTHNSAGEVHTIEKIITHPNYDSWTMDYDIALLKTTKEMNLSPINGVNNIRLIDSNFNFNRKNLTISGWGYTRENGCTLPTDLLSIELPSVDEYSCNTSYNGQITERMFCAGNAGENRGICQGDSGGPVTVIDGGVRKLAGIVSFAYGCARPGYPAVLANMATLGTWIQQNAV